jgi:hypothetical protein
MIERTPAAELETKRRILDAIDRQGRGRIPSGPPYISPLERRVIALEAVVGQLLELPVVRHSGVVTATLEGE